MGVRDAAGVGSPAARGGAGGRLIAVEGVEGAGKTTQAAMLAGAIGAELTREPGGSPVGERVRELLLDPGLGPVAPRAELLLVCAARAQHLTERIEPALALGRDVVVDRFAGSTLAYQGYGRQIPVAEVRLACDVAASGRWPDISVLLDVPVDLGFERLEKLRAAGGGAAGLDRIEAEDRDFFVRVREGFLQLAADDPTRWMVLDAAAPAELVSRALIDALRQWLASERSRPV
jgi:dTMP kinase